MSAVERSPRERVDDELALLAHAVVVPTPGAQRPVAEALERAYSAEDAVHGWSPGCGRAHPSGGYLHRVVATGDDGGEVVHFLGDGARSHRTDGPATMTYDGAGRLRQARWQVDGYHHRSDGPAVLGHGERSAFVVAGFNALAGSFAMARFDALLALGADQATAVAWLVVATGVRRREDVSPLVTAGVDVGWAQEAVDAGVTEVDELLAGWAAAAPPSWLATGS